MQRRIDPGMAVPYPQARPAAQSTVPTPRDDDTPPRRSKTSPQTPDRQMTQDASEMVQDTCEKDQRTGQH